MLLIKQHLPWLVSFVLAVCIVVGYYSIAPVHSMLVTVYQRVTGDYGLPPPVHITFIEGTTVSDYSERSARSFQNVSVESFLEAAKGQDGYLFPDTYFFQPSADAVEIVARMRSNFDTKIATLEPDIRASGHSLSDIVTMASIIEGEASSTVDRHMVSGILWNRLALEMPLQVDVARETYTHKGFPNAPINNPSLDALDAAVSPTKTSYLYYLTGNDGLMHYATTFAGHQANLRKYLR
ncbi:MAG: endolytic transglycosylase MltG [Candidatus Paceibacterota bacterium]|jgi:UPF0755 protein